MQSPRRIKPAREDLKAGEVLCDHCTAKCCKYFALPIDKPDTRKEFDYVRWFLLHEKATIFTEDGTWYLLVHTQCRHLQDNNLCGIYETRPQLCRDYTTDNCEYDDSWVYEQYFETPEQMQEYIEATQPRKRGETFRSPKPKGLPIVRVLKV